MVGDESFEKIDEFVVDDLCATGCVRWLHFLLLIFFFGQIGEERLLLEGGLDVFEFGYVKMLKTFPSLNSFEEGFAFFHRLLHVLDRERFKEFINLKGKVLANIWHERGVRIVGTMHWVPSFVFWHKVVEH